MSEGSLAFEDLAGLGMKEQSDAFISLIKSESNNLNLMIIQEVLLAWSNLSELIIWEMIS